MQIENLIYRSLKENWMIVCKKQLSELFDGMVTIEYMDDYIGDIEYRVLSGMLPPEAMRFVERYKEYKHQH